MEIFEPPVAPSPGTTIKPKLKLLKVEFGDGYTQGARDGINFTRDTLTLSWDLLTPDEANYIDNFMRARGGVETFFYTVSDAVAQQKWTCDDWTVGRITGGMRTVEAKLVQSFNLV